MSNKTLADITNDPKKMQTLVQYFEDRDRVLPDSPQEAAEEFLSDYRYLHANTVGAFDFVNYVRGINTDNPQKAEYKKNLGELYEFVDKEVDQIFSEDATLGQAFEGVGEYAYYAITDPINLLGLGVGKVASIAASRAAIKGLVNQSFKSGLSEALTKAQATKTGRAALGFAGAATIDAPVSSTMEYQTQQAEKELGVREETNTGEVLAAGVLGGLVSGVPTAALSAFTDPLKKVRETKEFLEKTDQGELAKSANLKEAPKAKTTTKSLLGKYVDVIDGIDEDMVGEYDPLGRIIGRDNRGNITVEFIPFDSKKQLAEGKPTRIKKNYSKDKLKAVSQLESDDRIASYIKNYGKDFDAAKIKEGRETYRKIAEGLGIDPSSDLAQFDLALSRDFMLKATRILNDLIASRPELVKVVDKRARVSEKVGALLELNGDILKGDVAEDLAILLNKHDMTSEELGVAFRVDGSVSGTGLGEKALLDFQGLGQDLLDSADKFTELDLQRISFAKQSEVDDKLAQGKIGAAVDIWRAFLVTQPATTFRNIFGSVALLPGESVKRGLDRYFMETSLRLQGKDPAEAPTPLTYKDSTDLITRVFNPEASIELMRLVAREHPEAGRQILDLYDDRLPATADEKASGVYKFFSAAARYGNFFNHLQDRAFKSAAFLSDLNYQIKLRKSLGETGFDAVEDLNDMIAKDRLDLLNNEMIARSTQAAYRLTFQNRKAGDRLLIGGSFVNNFQDLLNQSPILKLAIPFPNFLANSFVYITNRMGGGLLKTAYRGTQIFGPGSKRAADTLVQDRETLTKVTNALNDLKYKPRGNDIIDKEVLRLADIGIDEAPFNTVVKNLKEKREGLLKNFGQQERNLEQFKEGLVETGEMGIALSVALAIRASQEGGEWYEFVDDTGETRDLRPLFPLAPFLFVADAMIRSYKDLPSSPRAFNEGMEALLGVSARAGTVGSVFRELRRFAEQDIKNPDNDKRFGTVAGNLFGYMLGGLSTPARAVTDVVRTVGGQEQRELIDRRQQEKVLENFGLFSEEMTRDNIGISSFVDEVVRNVVQGTPFERSVMGEADTLADPFADRDRLASRTAFRKQLTGVASLGLQSDVQKELARVGVDKFRISEYSKTPEYDNIYNVVIGRLSNTIVDSFIRSDEYQSLEPIDQKRALENLYLSTSAEDLSPLTKKHLRRSGPIRTSLKQVAADFMESYYPVLNDLRLLEKKFSNEDIAEAIEALKERDPTFNLEYIDERSADQTKVSKLQENIEKTNELASYLRGITKQTLTTTRAARTYSQ